MNLFKFTNSRIPITLSLIILQFVWLIILLLRLLGYSTRISALFSAISILMVLYIISKEENAAYKIGWIILIMEVPLLGGLLYIIFGNKRPSKKLRNCLNREHEKLLKYVMPNKKLIDEISKVNERAKGTCCYLQDTNNYPIYKDTSTKYYPLGENMYKDMLIELEKAKHFIFLEFFIIRGGVMWNSILEILIRKVREGVDVRLIYDDVGSLFMLPRGYDKKLEKMGIQCIAFNQFRPILSLVMNHRDHRKIMIIDGITAFNGGINLADEYINKDKKYGHWKDTGICLKGPAVWNFTLMFLEMWNALRKNNDSPENFKPAANCIQTFESDGYVQPFADSPLDNEALGENMYIEILSQATKYVYIFTPYLIIDHELKAALCMAAKRGVDVRIVTPGIPDKKIIFRLTRSNYLPLLKAGVKIYEYTPGFIHAKSYVSDDEFAVIGTINMDYRSLYLHFECGTFLYQTKAIMDLKKDALNTISKSREIKPCDCREGVLGSLFDAVLRVFAPLC